MSRHITIITPCYNESSIVISFLERLECVLAALPFSFVVLVINDCSTDDTLPLLKAFRFMAANASLQIISLPRNMGHQAAIYTGFLHARSLECDNFIVMDSDGEDAPAVIPLLLEHLDADIVNVVRKVRKESLPFRVCYYIYKIIFRAVTGKRMNFGNFCLVSRLIMERAISNHFTHLAAFLCKQNCVTRFLVADRQLRIGGKSKMGFKKLFYHALRSFTEYGYDIHARFFKRTATR